MQENIFLNHKLKRYWNEEEYLIDIQLRAFLLEILEHIENTLKQAFINEVWKNYDNIDFYRDTFKDDVDLFIKNKTKYLKIKDNECKKIKWKINVNIFISKITFWEILHLFRKLNIKYKKNINNNSFWFKKIKFFEDWINNIRFLRNLVCHWDNLFNRKFERKIDFYNTLENNNNFKWYFLILGVFSKILWIEDKLFKIWKFLQNEKDAPGIKHISEEIEAWYVLANSLYEFYVKKSNLKLEKINIIQFMPYFPPHKWGVETVWEEIGKKWVENNLWEFVNIVTNFEQEGNLDKNEKIIFENEVIWYKKDWVEVLVCPSLEIINNFPVYKIWDKKYKLILKYIKEKPSPQPSPLGGEGVEQSWRIITHTRFFLTSFIWWLFARNPHLTSPKERGINGSIKWIHIEHWSDYVKLSSKIKTNLSIIYDKTFWKWIFKKADKILAISQACKNFINREFIDREVEVFYRGIEFSKNIKIKENLSEKFNNKIIIWYVWRLYKWKNVESLIKAFYNLDEKIQNKLQLVVVWDWEDFERLKKTDKENKIYFTWWESFENALSYQKQFDIHIHPSSPWWWLATTLLQAMNFWCLIVATPNEWAKEVITNNKNWFLLKNDSIEELEKWIKLAIENLEKKEEFSVQNKKIIKEKFSWEKNILKLYNLLK